MPRKPRKSAGGVVYHCLNRANARDAIFLSDGDYLAFEKVLAQAMVRTPLQLFAYCIMPNHFHLLLRPRKDGDLSAFMGWLTMTHTQRWHQSHQTVGTGHLYQGRFKSFPVQEDKHFLIAARYVERNPLRARLVESAQRWKWSSLRRRETADDPAHSILNEWPVQRPSDWLEWVNAPQSQTEEAALRQSITRGRPYGSAPWQQRTASKLGLEHTYRQRGRPKRKPAAADS